MPAAPISPGEIRRLAAVQKLRLLGTPAEERFDKITRLAKRMFNVPMACIDIVGEKLAWLKSVQGFDGIEGLRKDSYCHYTVLDEGVCIVLDARRDPRVHDSSYADTWVFYAGVPLHFEDERVGVLCIGDTSPRDFDTEHLEALSDLAELAERELHVAALSEAQTALALSNEELEMKARIDVLTHAWNRGAILEIIAAEQLRVASGSSTSILIIDIDHFKTINDTFGHPAGDEVLRIVAARLRASVRPLDAVGRYGGEEFLLVLPETNIDGAVRAGERICDAISQTPVEFGPDKIPVACSIGCATFSDAISDDVDALIQRADRALYRAKVSGRNRVAREIAVPAIG
ncbi:GGDEF domain-containing protein [Acidicapsa dinghuensis]|uniref:diguanylate cyclase n=1 Tax=Acidicapsa dinghuensis TaxID=2218256 RepID=A0ABW1EJG4_9BACT|nr:sensor domain-containing diguanylate cyclase [Acidicapsa dinghuensis]